MRDSRIQRQQEHLKSATILIVDDNPNNLQMLSDYLEGQGFKTLIARDGELAIKRACYAQPSLILLDVIMPGMDGFETCRQLKQDERTRDIPVIFMTALASSTQDKVRGFEVGAVDYITKPIQQEEVSARVETHLEIRHLTKSLQMANQELSKTLHDLKTTQQQLIETEKLAAVSELIAGVAHEINTPLGVGITASSGVEDRTKIQLNALEEGKLSRSALESYLKHVMQSSHLILENLMRAADLVRSLKQVTHKRYHAESRPFPVKSYIEKSAVSVIPESKREQYTLTVEGDASMTMHNSPGAFSQVIAGLVANSLMNAYAPDEPGHLYFALSRTGETVHIVYSDDGHGIPSEYLEKVFDPFFTAPRQRGGMGLGLYIVYNLVTQKLQGRIVCESQVGEGTIFRLEFPVNTKQTNYSIIHED